MPILRARTAGFCMGVGLALRRLEQALAQQPAGRLVMLGPIIHNPQVLDEYTRQGVLCIHEPQAIQPGDTVIIRAHGIPMRDEAYLGHIGAQVIDATCPKVKAAQLAIAEATADGTPLVLFGEAEHPEVKGLVSYAHGHCDVFGSLAELLAAMPEPAAPLVLAAQTTQEREEFEEIRTRLEARGPLTVLSTICDATRKRQKEAQELARQVEAMIVVGGKTSGNTRRLADVIQSCGVPVWHIETPEELPSSQLAAYTRIGLTAGASTPKSIIDAVEHRLQKV